MEGANGKAEPLGLRWLFVLASLVLSVAGLTFGVSAVADLAVTVHYVGHDEVTRTWGLPAYAMMWASAFGFFLSLLAVNAAVRRRPRAALRRSAAVLALIPVLTLGALAVSPLFPDFLGKGPFIATRAKATAR